MIIVNYDFLNLNSVTNRMWLAGRAIDSSTSSIPDPSNSYGIMISEYVKRARKIGELMEKYKQLIDKDVRDIEKIQSVMRDADRRGRIIVMKY